MFLLKFPQLVTYILNSFTSMGIQALLCK